MQSFHKLITNQDDFIAYHKISGNNDKVGVIFLGGFMSDMEGTKALALESFCKKENHNFIRFDYFGHGSSSKSFTECNISIWLENVLDVIDKLATGKQILIGSSMGGWLMLLAALKRPERISALIGIASAPDFTEELIWDAFSQQQQQQLLEKGLVNLSSEYGEAPYPITKSLIEDGRNNLLLKDDNIKINVPVRLIHGEKDMDVPASISQRLFDKLTSKDKNLQLIADGDHRMSTPENIKLLYDNLKNLLNSLS